MNEIMYYKGIVTGIAGTLAFIILVMYAKALLIG